MTLIKATAEEKNITTFSNLQILHDVKAYSIINGIDQITKVKEKIAKPYDLNLKIGDSITFNIYGNLQDKDLFAEIYRNLLSKLLKQIYKGGYGQVL